MPKKSSTVYRITVRKLRVQGYCTRHVDEFAKLYPKGAPFSKAVLQRANKAGLDVGHIVFHTFCATDIHSKDEARLNELVRSCRGIYWNAYWDRSLYRDMLISSRKVKNATAKVIDALWKSRAFRDALRDEIAVRKRTNA